MTWVPIPGALPPPGLPLASTAELWSATDPHRGRLCLWASAQRTMWLWNGNAWSSVAGGPAIRSPLGWHGSTQSLVLTGDVFDSSSRRVSRDTWTFDTAWHQAELSPVGFSHPKARLDPGTRTSPVNRSTVARDTMRLWS